MRRRTYDYDRRLLERLEAGRGGELAPSRRGARPGGQYRAAHVDHAARRGGRGARRRCIATSRPGITAMPWSSGRCERRAALHVSARRRLPAQPVPARDQVRFGVLRPVPRRSRGGMDEDRPRAPSSARPRPSTATSSSAGGRIPISSSWPSSGCAWRASRARSSTSDNGGESACVRRRVRRTYTLAPGSGSPRSVAFRRPAGGAPARGDFVLSRAGQRSGTPGSGVLLSRQPLDRDRETGSRRGGEERRRTLPGGVGVFPHRLAAEALLVLLGVHDPDRAEHDDASCTRRSHSNRP